MARRVLPAFLVFAALVADVSGSHDVSLGLLFAAIPAAFVLALDCYADSLEARCTGVRPVVAAVAVILLVLSAALRSPAVVGGVPQLAVTVLVIALALYAAISVGALLPVRSARRPDPAYRGAVNRT